MWSSIQELCWASTKLLPGEVTACGTVGGKSTGKPKAGQWQKVSMCETGDGHQDREEGQEGECLGRQQGQA